MLHEAEHAKIGGHVILVARLPRPINGIEHPCKEIYTSPEVTYGIGVFIQLVGFLADIDSQVPFPIISIIFGHCQLASIGLISGDSTRIGKLAQTGCIKIVDSAHARLS